MKLTYRGVQFQSKEENHLSLVPLAETTNTTNKEIIYRGNSPTGRIKPNFPWLGYIKQLFGMPESNPILDPITFWYDHKRKFIAECWFWGDIDRLNHAWDLTIQREQAEALKSKQKIKLKYRGITYYK